MMEQERIRCPQLLDKVISAEEAAWMIEDGMNIGVSGFTPSGYPKAVPLALAEQVKSGQRQLKVNLWSGASIGAKGRASSGISVITMAAIFSEGHTTYGTPIR